MEITAYRIRFHEKESELERFVQNQETVVNGIGMKDARETFYRDFPDCVIDDVSIDPHWTNYARKNVTP